MMNLNQLEAELLRAEDELQTIDQARQQPYAKQKDNGTLLQRAYESARDRRDAIERDVWRLRGLQVAREMETTHADD